jgi:hypothetical protein
LRDEFSELVHAGRPLASLAVLDDTALRDVFALASGGASFFDSAAGRGRSDDRYVIDGTDLAAWPLRAELHRRCAELLADQSWAREALDRTLGDPAVLDVIGAPRVSGKARVAAQELLVDMPSGAAGALNAALFDAMSSAERHKLESLFADSPHAPSVVWFPASWGSMRRVREAATLWLDRNAPAPSLFDDAPSGDGDGLDPIRSWMEALANLFSDKSAGSNGVYLRRNAADTGSVRLNADLFAAVVTEIASRARLACMFSGAFSGRDPKHRPRFDPDPAATAAVLVERLGRPLQQSDLALLPPMLAAIVAPTIPASAVLRRTEGSVVIGDGQLLSRLDIVEFALDPERNNVLPSKAQIENLDQVEQILGETWKDFCDSLCAMFPELRMARSSYERRLDSLLLELSGAPVPIEVFVRDATPEGLLTSSRCRIDAVWQLDEFSSLWFEADGEGHFVAVKNWDLERARDGDQRRHRQLRAALDAGWDVTLVAIHHQLLSAKASELDAEMLDDIVGWARDEGYHWVFLRPSGCVEMRWSLSEPSEQTSVRFGDIEVVVAERRRVECHV